MTNNSFSGVSINNSAKCNPQITHRPQNLDSSLFHSCVTYGSWSGNGQTSFNNFPTIQACKIVHLSYKQTILQKSSINLNKLIIHGKRES